MRKCGLQPRPVVGGRRPALAIRQEMLSQQLRDLERDGLVIRTVH